MKPINIGFGNIVLSSRVVSITSAESAPLKRAVQEAREKGVLVDATHGRRTRSIIFTDAGIIIISALSTETITNRLSNLV